MLRFVSALLLLPLLGTAGLRSEAAQTSQTPAESDESDDTTASENAIAGSEPSDEIQPTSPPPPPKKPPPGLLPVGEVARLDYPPRERPKLLLYGNHLVVVGRSGFAEGYHAETGAFAWKLGLPGEELFQPIVFEAAPVERGETDVLTVVLSSPSGYVVFVNGLTGEIQQETRLPFELALPPTRGPGNVLYFATPSGEVVAYDVDADEVVFQTETGERPLAVASSDSVLVVSGDSQTLTALELPSGTPRWTFRGRAAFHASAVFDDSGNRVYIGDDAGEIYCLEAGTGEVKFRWSTGAAIRSPALVEGERVYWTSFANTLFAFHASSGDEHWRANLPGRPATGPMRVRNRLVVATYDGILVEINPGRGQVGERYRAPGEILEPPSFFLAQPSPNELDELLTEAPSDPTADSEEDGETDGDGLDPDIFGPEELDGAPAPPPGPPAEAPTTPTTPTTETEDVESSDLEAPTALELPDEPAWFERSRIAMALRSGEVLLLAHQPPQPEPAPEDADTPTDEDAPPGARPQTR